MLIFFIVAFGISTILCEKNGVKFYIVAMRRHFFDAKRHERLKNPNCPHRGRDGSRLRKGIGKSYGSGKVTAHFKEDGRA